MTTNNDLVHACDRALQGINEVKGHAIRLMQLEQQVKAAQDALAGLNAKIKQAEAQAAEIDKTDQTIRQKRTDLAELEAVIAKKHEEHGKVDGDLRSLEKRIKAFTAVG